LFDDEVNHSRVQQVHDYWERMLFDESHEIIEVERLFVVDSFVGLRVFDKEDAGLLSKTDLILDKWLKNTGKSDIFISKG